MLLPSQTWKNYLQTLTMRTDNSCALRHTVQNLPVETLGHMGYVQTYLNTVLVIYLNKKKTIQHTLNPQASVTRSISPFSPLITEHMMSSIPPPHLMKISP